MEGYDQILYLSDLIVERYDQMERYDQILYLSDLIAPNGEVWIKYCTSVTW